MATYLYKKSPDSHNPPAPRSHPQYIHIYKVETIVWYNV